MCDGRIQTGIAGRLEELALQQASNAVEPDPRLDMELAAIQLLVAHEHAFELRGDEGEIIVSCPAATSVGAPTRIAAANRETRVGLLRHIVWACGGHGFFGKGFGDLPDSLSWLRPFAVTGAVTLEHPLAGSSTNFGIDPETGQLGPTLTRNVDTVHLLAVDQLNTYDVLLSDDVVFTRRPDVFRAELFFRASAFREMADVFLRAVML